MTKEATNKKTGIVYTITEDEFRHLVELKKDKLFTIRDIPEKRLKNFEPIPAELKTTKSDKK